uniref:IRK_C domain-containing protein n=1 Tax=Heligmosomoides polygyrus TaxID=6339 RepID=A0A183F5G8_HELPZ
LHQFEMKVGPTITDDDRLFLVWPTTLCHVINKDSPLYEYTANSLLSAQFEIICLLEGIVESTGMTAQAKTSYLPCEILWGHRFRKLVTYQRSNGSYQIDYNLFNSTYAVKTPHCSAMEHYAQECSPKDYFCHDSHEHKLEDSRSWESSPAPSPSPFSYPASPLPPHHMYPPSTCNNNNNNNRNSEALKYCTLYIGGAANHTAYDSCAVPVDLLITEPLLTTNFRWSSNTYRFPIGKLSNGKQPLDATEYSPVGLGGRVLGSGVTDERHSHQEHNRGVHMISSIAAARTEMDDVQFVTEFSVVRDFFDSRS